MAAPITLPIADELVIDSPAASSLQIPLEQSRYRLGRAPGNELAFPDDPKLSREHLIFERDREGWMVRDPGSLNGTLLNGNRLSAPVRLQHGDRIIAGHLSICYRSNHSGAPEQPDGITFTEHPVEGGAQTVSVNLKAALERAPRATEGSAVESAHFAALVRAGRELAGTGALDELFELVLDLSLSTVKASRGVVMTMDGAGEMQVRAVRGEKLRISAAVRDLVTKEARSLLVRDVLLDQNLALQASIVMQDIRSILAVPLQTDERVIGLIYLDSPQRIREFTTADLNLITVIANIAAIRIEHARLIEREQARRLFEQDLERAAEIQRGLLPAAPPNLRGFDLAGYNMPCRTVGGDYYDFLPYPDGRMAVLIGDVAGKGLGAALVMSSLQARTQVIFSDPANLAAEVTRLNQSMARNCPANCFVTFFIAVLDPGSDEVVYCNAGHNPPLVVHRTGEVSTLPATGIPLGITGRAAYEQKSFSLREGESILLFSDGITEAVPPGCDDEFGEERLKSLIQKWQNAPARSLVHQLKTEVLAHACGPAADDMTLVAVRRVSGGGNG
jgi:phosphoserine phosphatase RsbU/P